MTANKGVCQSGAREMCGCREKHGHMQCPCATKYIISTLMEHAAVGNQVIEQRGKIEILEKHRESLKRELDGVEEELKQITEES